MGPSSACTQQEHAMSAHGWAKPSDECAVRGRGAQAHPLRQDHSAGRG
ncbi:hypothetical protein ACFPRL_34500 [Pseudoclavibacter helvolus]